MNLSINLKWKEIKFQQTLTFVPTSDSYLLHKSFFDPQNFKHFSPLASKSRFQTFLTLEEENNLSEVFLFRRSSTVKSFFTSQLIDVPICFRKSKSLYNPTFELPLLKLYNILMRRGQKRQVMKFFSTSSKSVFTQMLLGRMHPTLFNWRDSVHVLNSFWLNSDGLINFKRQKYYRNQPTFFKNSLSSRNYIFPARQTFLPQLLKKLSSFSPVFNFYVRKIDKNIRKNSRGKGEKYSIIWKYVPPYKRSYLALRWLFRDLKFQKNFTFVKKLEKTLEAFIFSPHLSFLPRLRKFVHLFVFFNHRLTLMQHLRSVS